MALLGVISVLNILLWVVTDHGVADEVRDRISQGLWSRVKGTLCGCQATTVPVRPVVQRSTIDSALWARDEPIAALEGVQAQRAEDAT